MNRDEQKQIIKEVLDERGSRILGNLAYFLLFTVLSFLIIVLGFTLAYPSFTSYIPFYFPFLCVSIGNGLVMMLLANAAEGKKKELSKEEKVKKLLRELKRI